MVKISNIIDCVPVGLSANSRNRRELLLFPFDDTKKKRANRPCLIYQNREYVCLGLTTSTYAIALRPELINIMQDVDIKILPVFMRGKRYTNKHTGKQYLFRTIDNVSIDTFIFIELETGQIRCFKGDNMESFVIEREDA